MLLKHEQEKSVEHIELWDDSRFYFFLDDLTFYFHFFTSIFARRWSQHFIFHNFLVLYLSCFDFVTFCLLPLDT